ncbi:MAG: hypothetical protein KAW12_23310 [Candidatus Aminicenantes bacterium]|nr:hypothetical protein [Candidatus Aminicenantes bacterium]
MVHAEAKKNRAKSAAAKSKCMGDILPAKNKTQNLKSEMKKIKLVGRVSARSYIKAKIS